MPLEIRVRAVPDTKDFETALQKAVSDIKVPLKAALDSAGLNTKASGGTSSSSRSSSSSVTNDLKAQLSIQKQLASLAQKADSLRLRGGTQFQSQNLTKLEQFLSTVRNADGSFKTINGDLDAFNKQLSEAATNSTRATAEFSKWQAQTRAENNIVSERAKLYDQLNTAVRRYNSAEALEKQGFVSETLNKYRDQISQYRTESGALKFDKGDIVDYTGEVKELAQAFRTVSTEAAAFTSRKTAERSLNAEATAMKNLTRQISDYINANPNLVNNKRGYKELEDIYKNLSTGSLDVSKARSQFAGVRAEMQAMGLETETLGQRVRKLFGDHFNTALALAGLNALRLGMQQVLTAVRDVDSAMTELRKVYDASASDYAAFMDRAAESSQRLGTSLSDNIRATAEAVKLGYDIDEAENLAESALVYLNVGDGVENVDEASASLISTMKAFNIEAENSIGIIDQYNEVGNKFSIGSSDIGEALQRSASALEFGNNTLEESIGLITAGFDIVQNPQMMGTALKTLSMNLRGAKAQLEEAGEDTEGMANSVAELRDELLTLTGVDIMLDEDTFKSTFQILQEISAVWDTMTDIDQAAALEAMAGKRQANTLSAIISNFDTAIAARDVALESSGSAWRENEAYLNSINGKIGQFQAAFQGLSTTVLDSGIVKYFIDMGTAIVSATQSITETVGGPGWLLGGALGAFASYRDAGIFSVIDNPDTFSGKEITNIFRTGPSKTEIQQIDTYNSLLKELGDTSGKSAQQIAKTQQQMSRLKAVTDNTRLGDYLKGLDGAPAVLGDFSSSLQGVSVKSKLAAAGLKALSVGANMAIGVLAGFAINAVINGLTWLAETEERVLEKTTEATAAYQENTASLEDYQARVSELRMSLDSGTLNYDETKAARQELISIQQAMIEQFGQEAGAADLVTQAIQGQSEAWEQLNDQQLEAWKLSMSEPEWNGQTGMDTAIKKMEERMAGESWRVGYSGMPDKYYSTMKEVQMELLQEYSDFFDFDPSRNIGRTASIGAITAPSPAEWSNLDTTEMRDAYVAKIREAFSGQATNAEIVEIQEQASHNLDMFLSRIQANAESVTAEWGEAYDMIGMLEVLENEDYSKIMDQLEIAESAYEEALSVGEDANINVAADTLQGVFDRIQGVIDSDNTPDVVKNYLQSILDESTYRDLINKSNFADAIKGQLADALETLEVDSEMDIYEAMLGDGSQRIKDIMGMIADAAADANIIPAIPEGEDIPLESLEILIDLLTDLGYISSNSAQSLAELTAEFSSLSTEMQAAQTEAQTVTEVLNAQSTGAGVTLDNYEALVAINEDYADALEYTNGVMTINAERAREIANADISTQITKAKIAMQDEAKQFKDNTDTIEEYTRKLATLVDAQGNIIPGNEDLANHIQSQIEALYDSNDAIQSNIDKYGILISSLREATGAYQLWQDAQNAPESGDMYDDTRLVIEDIKEGLDSGKVGTKAYTTAVDLLIPDDVSSEGEAAIEQYKKNVLDRYATFDSEDGEALATGISNFTYDALQKGLAETTEDGNWEVVAGKTMEDFAEALHLTPEMVQAIFGELEEYGGEFQWSEEFEQSLQLSEEEVSQYVSDITDDILSIPTIEIRTNIDSIAEQEAELYDLTHPNLAPVLEEVPVNIKARFQLAQTKEELEAEKQALLAQLETTTDPDEIESIQTQIYEVEQKIQKTETIETNLEPPTEEDIAAVKSAISGQRAELQVELKEANPEQAETIKAQIAALGQLDAQIDIMGNSQDWTEKKDTVVSDKDALESDPATVTIDANNSNALWKISNVRATLNALDGTTATTYINTVNTTTYRTQTESVRGNRKWGGEQSVANGTAHAFGTARASGDWGLEKPGRTLVGELGQELVVDPHSGKWHTVGDFGPEFVDLPKDAIVFNHKQTEDLLKKGYVLGRGEAMASGNAMVSGGVPIVNIQVGTGNATWSGGWNGSWTSSSINNVTSSTNDLNNAVQETQEEVSNAADEVEEYVSDLWELYEVETALSDIQAGTSILETKLDMAENIVEAVHLREQIIDQYEAEQDALHNLAEARRELIAEDIAELEEKGFIINYDPEYNKLLIENTEHVNDLVGEVSGSFETAEDREKALQEATNDLRKETEDMINSLVDMNDANQDASQSWWELEQSMIDVKQEMADDIMTVFDDFIDYMDSFELWADSAEDRIEVLSKKQAELNRLYEIGYLTMEQYKDLTFDNQVEIYNQQKDAIVEIIELTEQMIEQEVRDKIDAIEKQIDAYRELIEIRKEALADNREEEDHQDELADKLEELARLRQRIDRLTLAAQTGDRAAAAEKVALEEEYNDLMEDLADYQADYSYDTQVDALDKELEAFEDKKNQEIGILEESIDTEVKLYQLAIDRINAGWDELYKDLMAYTKEYGDAIDGEDSLKTAWEIATEAVKDYAYNVEAALEGIKTEGSLSNIVTNRANEIVSQMKENSQAWHTATPERQDELEAINEQLAKQLSALIGRPVVKDYWGTWFLDSNVNGTPLFDVYPTNGTTSGSTEQESQENVNQVKVMSLAAEMRLNSAKWHNATDSDEQAYYERENRNLAAEISRILGRKLILGDDGVWYFDRVGGQKLYDIYHKGGVVGSIPSAGDNEVFALLEKGEYVLTDKQQSALSKLVKLGQLVTGEAKSALVSALSPTTAFGGGDTFNAEFEVNFNVGEGLSEATMKKYGSAFADIAIKKIQSGFNRSGITANKVALGKA